MIKRILFCTLFCLTVLGCATKESSNSSIAWNMINNGALLVDVRTPEEFASGHIVGAKNIPLSDLEKNSELLEAELDRQIVLYCRSGRRAGMAAALLSDNGFEAVYNAGGYANLRNKKP